MDKIYNDILREQCTAAPSVRTFWKLKWRRAWTVKQSEADVRRVFRQHPQTTMLTCTIAGAVELNNICIRAKFPRREPLAIVHADVEANPAKYFRSTYKPLGEVHPYLVSLRARMHIFLTRNVRKDVDFVNGMAAVVESWNAQNGFVTAITLTNRRIAVWPLTIPTVSRGAFFPFRPGYGPTILRHQGNLIKHLHKDHIVSIHFSIFPITRRTTDTRHRVPRCERDSPVRLTLLHQECDRRRHPLRRRLNRGAF